MLKCNLPSFFHFVALFHLSLQYREICVKDLSRTTTPRILKFGIKIGCFLFGVRDNQHPQAYHSLYLSVFFFFSHEIFVADFSALIRARVFKFCMHIQRVEEYCIKETHDGEIYSLQCNAYGNLCQRVLKNYCT